MDGLCAVLAIMSTARLINWLVWIKTKKRVLHSYGNIRLPFVIVIELMAVSVGAWLLHIGWTSLENNTFFECDFAYVGLGTMLIATRLEDRWSRLSIDKCGAATPSSIILKAEENLTTGHMGDGVPPKKTKTGGSGSAVTFNV